MMVPDEGIGLSQATAGDDQFRLLIRDLNVGVLLQGPASEILIANPAALELLGLTESQLLGRTSIGPEWNVIHDNGAPFPGPTHPVPTAIATRKPVRNVTMGVYRPSSQDRVWLSVNAEPVLHQDGSVKHVLCTFVNITELREAQRSLAAQVEAMRLKDRALDGIHNGVIVVDAQLPDMPVIYVNGGFSRITGYSAEEVVGRNCRFLQGPEKVQEGLSYLRSALAASRPATVLLRNYKKDGSLFWNELSVSPITSNGSVTHFIGIQKDVTEQIHSAEEKRRTEAQLFHSQKLDALGQMAGAVAHEFNNILAAQMSYAEILSTSDVEPQDVRQYAGKILSAGWRGAAVARQLLALAKKNPQMNEAVQLSTLLADVRDLLAHLFPKSIRIESDVVLANECVRGDSGLLQQAVLNLCLNSRDAMPSGGILRIGGRRAQSAPPGGHGPFLELTIEDSGIGMTQEVRDHIFDPFFTTKEKGTGLGLNIVSSIVVNHGGRIEVESTAGKGTVFRILLPQAVGVTAVHVEHVEEPVRGQGQTILLAEDEEEIRAGLREFLTRIGYKCLDAENALVALELFAAHRSDVAAVITDYDMPGMDGAEFARRIHAASEAMPIILTSGYVESGPSRDLALPPGTKMILKPFRLAEISALLSQMISR
jgi:two-component system cell cycle sensor histidine kinase/response regulator CckA